MIRYGENVDPVLGFNLTGGSLHAERGKENLIPIAMEQDLEDVALVGKEGKKRPRGETEDIIGKEELRNVLEIGEWWKVIIYYRRLPNGKPTGNNENSEYL